MNETLRRGLATARPARREPFRILARSLGGLRPGLQVDNIAALIESAEGRRHR